ncbi:MFS transporter [Neisseria dentiae]|uniref:MFS transporter n=1 Tax=Neisseria dentiae TaxID=194197 RepID=UPI0035A1A2DD
MNQSKLLFWSITVALAGFLFGFDTVVISGADQALQKLWNSSDAFHGLVVMASALWGTVIGALFGSIPTDKLGRKKTLIIIGFLYIIGALGSALVSDPYLFAFFRFVGGLGAAWVFVGFTAMMVLQLLFVMFMMPETKGVPLEELSKSLIKENT